MRHLAPRPCRPLQVLQHLLDDQPLKAVDAYSAHPAMAWHTPGTRCLNIKCARVQVSQAEMDNNSLKRLLRCLHPSPQLAASQPELMQMMDVSHPVPLAAVLVSSHAFVSAGSPCYVCHGVACSLCRQLCELGRPAASLQAFTGRTLTQPAATQQPQQQQHSSLLDLASFRQPQHPATSTTPLAAAQTAAQPTAGRPQGSSLASLAPSRPPQASSALPATSGGAPSLVQVVPSQSPAVTCGGKQAALARRQAQGLSPAKVWGGASTGQQSGSRPFSIHQS